MVIEKVICQSDQQASLFLQQKLKLATPIQKHEIIDTIVRHSHPLMVNRFGNFLVQRCFEYGTKEQIDGIVNAIRGNVVTLSMDMFGCHVIQKAIDCVDEEYKVAMVKELLCHIPETVSHRFACHVWQKLLEIRWRGTAPVIMKYVNDALKGLWTEIALGETGSLVVQNIFENCLDQDKVFPPVERQLIQRPCIEEILENVDTIARGQWGNWVIQHIVEHGHPDDRLRALDIILNRSAGYSTDQFASKVIEKSLKCCGPEIFQSYISKICEKEPGRPRVALIDISSDIYGNYLIQYVLQNGPQIVRDQISFHVRKHMVSLRGSRYGQRVAFQVERLRTAQKSTNWQGRWD